MIPRLLGIFAFLIFSRTLFSQSSDSLKIWNPSDVSSDYSTYILTSPAFTMKKGQTTIEVLGAWAGSYPSIRHGMTNNLQMEFGLSPIALANGVLAGSLTTKFSLINSGPIRFGTSITMLGAFDAGYSYGGGAPYISGYFTIGDSISNISLGLGQFIGVGELVRVYQLAGAKYVSERTALILDTQFLRSDYSLGEQLALILAGVRLRRKHHSWDFFIAGVYLPEDGIGGAAPSVSYRVDLR